MSDELLIIEDDAMLGIDLKRHFERGGGWRVRLVRSLREAEPFVFGTGYEGLVVLSDLHLPDGNALELLERARGEGDSREWIFLTGFGEAPDAERAKSLGAFDFLTKPMDRERLERIVTAARRGARAQRRIADDVSQQRSRYSPAAFIGRSEEAARVRDTLARLCRLPLSSIIISGETGTGKGLAARILHHSGSRADGPLVEVNCAALPRELVESELFGHEAGAFTGAKNSHRGFMEQASDGTLFLDEIGELNLDLQAKLLKALEDKVIRRVGGERMIPVDVQIVAASNRNLQEFVAEKGFRADLYHRLSVFQLELPPLRSRKADLDELVDGLIREFNAIAGKRVKRVPEAVRALLATYDWPGNVRELRNVLERSVLLSTGEDLPAEWLQIKPGGALPMTAASGDVISLPLDGSMGFEAMEKLIIEAALQRDGNNVMATARRLGLTRETLRYRMARHGLQKATAPHGQA
ncbi:sigma-54-dependent transcriptional regulator [Mesorhizobium muleiense]|uniref:sigma-54-dependent transcriptional regulator n=1 Tax=Mesorhizobium muleiense TaxID=1004279 RepID=UPI001F166CAD|nr:sigma-54 dependent transcriptional regulator [Mesorhizobium muleiense]MCF6112184.1 sigma-54 dependent transcriptional regulator [Mesorhizobium muleiense]